MTTATLVQRAAAKPLGTAPNLTLALVACTIAPLLIIGVQQVLGLHGVVGYSLYKLAFLLGPWLFCRWQSISLARQVVGIAGWRRQLPLATLLGLAGLGIFWLAYALWADQLLDIKHIVAQIQHQFSVNATTVLIVAPFTICLNSLVEEFFYRGFAFGQLVRRARWLGWLLPAAAFTVQHILFIYHWVEWPALTLAVLGLMVFALVMQWLYRRAQSIVAPWVAHMLGDIAMMGIAARMLGVL
jgi:membrane protease YdiL (CAAX protease family)